MTIAYLVDFSTWANNVKERFKKLLVFYNLALSPISGMTIYSHRDSSTAAPSRDCHHFLTRDNFIKFLKVCFLVSLGFIYLSPFFKTSFTSRTSILEEI